MLDQSSAYWNIYDSKSYSLTHFNDDYKIISGQFELHIELNISKPEFLFPILHTFRVCFMVLPHQSISSLVCNMMVLNSFYIMYTLSEVCSPLPGLVQQLCEKNMAELSEIVASFSSQQVHISFILSVPKLL